MSGGADFETATGNCPVLLVTEFVIVVAVGVLLPLPVVCLLISCDGETDADDE